jgi:hypothetical protein
MASPGSTIFSTQQATLLKVVHKQRIGSDLGLLAIPFWGSFKGGRRHYYSLYLLLRRRFFWASRCCSSKELVCHKDLVRQLVRCSLNVGSRLTTMSIGDDLQDVCQ